MKSRLLYILFILTATSLFAQTPDSLNVSREEVLVVQDTINNKQSYDPLAPSRAAFYSAVLPGLGQAYNKKYWKIPIIYAGMATGVYFYIQNDKDYDRFRDAYKRRLAGFTDDEFYGSGTTPVISDDRLIDAQISAQKNKDISIIVSLAFYLVNIIDANVDAHLSQYNVSDDLTLSPNLYVDPISTQANYSLSFKFNLK
ncbi:hypothetical protein C5O00_00625 [Pukyongia salina]|uniref:DUF5683 domain-containing protein n=1 Tax=Pukyongia salina TaxID=2094025 RepID=A0A2S0HSX6_9FLAO|nr:DUF5683 domain-containing protein [Pukyongia salina]AVI49745.1 hypothetical protein C5O00_00625 [Pukyongia salina]